MAVHRVKETRNGVEGEENCGAGEVKEGGDSKNYSQVTLKVIFVNNKKKR